MLAYFWFEDKTLAWYNSHEEPGYFVEAVSYVPTVVYSLAIIIMNQLYRPLAIKLNEWGVYLLFLVVLSLIICSLFFSSLFTDISAMLCLIKAICYLKIRQLQIVQVR